eukprot:gene2928-5753_t
MLNNLLLLVLVIGVSFLTNVRPTPLTVEWSGCISHHEVKDILKLKTITSDNPIPIDVSLDLGITKSKVLLTREGLSDLKGNVMTTWSELGEIMDKAEKGQPGCYSLYDDGCKPWRISVVSPTTGIPAYLCPQLEKSGAPTMVLGGFTMHRIAGENMDPMVDTLDKINSLNPMEGHSVLDTCMGLGYTAIESAHRVSGRDRHRDRGGSLYGSSSSSSGGKVITIEYDDASVDMCKSNPWSQGLFDGSLPIEILRGDACDIIQTLPDASFDGIVHDPPARALCRTDLYGLEFYKQLRRVLRDGGKLYHYIGNPTSKESGTLYSGVATRLGEAGFTVSKQFNQAFGVLAETRPLLRGMSPVVSRITPTSRLINKTPPPSPPLPLPSSSLSGGKSLFTRRTGTGTGTKSTKM